LIDHWDDHWENYERYYSETLLPELLRAPNTGNPTELRIFTQLVKLVPRNKWGSLSNRIIELRTGEPSSLEPSNKGDTITLHEVIIRRELARTGISRSDLQIQSDLLDLNLDSIKNMLEKGAEIEVKNKSGENPLLVAVKTGDVEVVELLLKKGANPESGDTDGNTPLRAAVKNQYLPIVKLLLAHGADIEIQNSFTKDFFTNSVWRLLGVGGRYSVEEWNIVIERSGSDFLDDALENQDYAAIELVSKSGFLDFRDPQSSDSDGNTPLMVAVKCQDSVAVELLLKTKSFDIEKSDSNGNTPLTVAVKNLDLTSVELLLKAGANTEKSDSEWNTPLLLAVKSRFLFIARSLVNNTNGIWIKNQDLAAIELLLKAEANIENADISGDTPLMVAVKSKLFSIAELLVNYGANTEIIDSDGNTPLLLAVKKKFLSIAELLINSGAHLEAVDDNGESILELLDNEFSYLERFKSLEQLDGFKLLRQRINQSV